MRKDSLARQSTTPSSDRGAAHGVKWFHYIEIGRVKQTRLASLIESLANVFVGYGVAVVSQIIVFPFFGLYTPLKENLEIGLIFTIVSIIRSFTLRRAFEFLRVHKWLR